MIAVQGRMLEVGEVVCTVRDRCDEEGGEKDIYALPRLSVVVVLVVAVAVAGWLYSVQKGRGAWDNGEGQGRGVGDRSTW